MNTHPPIMCGIFSTSGLRIDDFRIGESITYGIRIKEILTDLLLNIANEAAVQNLRTVFVTRESLKERHTRHVHGTFEKATSNWDNIHLLHLPDERSLIQWFSRVHLAKRFADFIILHDLDILCSWQSITSTNVLRLTSLMEETRQFVHSATTVHDHGHGCRLLVTCGVSSATTTSSTPALPAHSLRESLWFSTLDDADQYYIDSVWHDWRLELVQRADELFWKSFMPDRNVSITTTTTT
ncbi:unnamed protein product [Dicrocoelium dendriticum]|nr:unnamed protein product [Dicrocoelium dendriticum]